MRGRERVPPGAARSQHHRPGGRLEEISDYQIRGRFDALVAHGGWCRAGARVGIFTELGILYAAPTGEAHGAPQALQHPHQHPAPDPACEEMSAWKELSSCTSPTTSTTTPRVMMTHPDAWEHISFKDVCVKVANVEVYYKALNFYLQDHPTQLNICSPCSLRDHTRVVDLMRKAGHGDG